MEEITRALHENAALKLQVASTQAGVIRAMVACIWESLRGGGKLLLCGNGGSAADAQHLATECMVRLQAERCALPALALTTDTSLLTAAANDWGFETIFARQVEGLGRAGDVLLVLSTSGNSLNVIRAVEEAHRQGLRRPGRQVRKTRNPDTAVVGDAAGNHPARPPQWRLVSHQDAEYAGTLRQESAADPP